MIFKRWLKDLLGFSNSEVNGTLVLVILVIITAILPRLYFQTATEFVGPTASEIAELNRWRDKIQAQLLTQEKEKQQIEEAKQITKHRFTFDPNDVSRQELVQLGLSSRVVKGVINYRKAGGSFRSKQDFRKIYGLDSLTYFELEPYLVFHKRSVKTKVKTSVKEKEAGAPIHIMDLNTATAEDLKEIRGIGEKLSARIVKYRTGLGGFLSLSQLEEVYGLKAEVIQRITERFQIKSPIQTISINTDSASHLFKHPYVDFKLGKTIVNYRKVHGDFSSVDQLLALKNLSDSTFLKIRPYLSVQP